MKNKEPKTRVYYMKDELMQGVCPICNRIVAIIISHKEKEILGVCGECGGMIFYSDEKQIDAIPNRTT